MDLQGIQQKRNAIIDAVAENIETHYMCNEDVHIPAFMVAKQFVLKLRNKRIMQLWNAHKHYLRQFLKA